MNRFMNRALSCHECQRHLVGYLDHRLSPRLLWRMDQHLNGCAICYAAYIQRRDLTRDLQSSLPFVGQANSQQLGRVWTAIQADMAQPKPAISTSLSRQLTHYSVAALILTLAILLPWSLDKQPVALALPSAPAIAVTAEVTETPTSVGTPVAMVIGATDPAIPAAQTPATPSPNTP